MAKYRFARVSATALAILSVAVLTGCGVSKSKYLEVTKSRDDLASQNQQLQSTLETTNKDKAQLEAEKAALQARVTEMDSTAALLGNTVAEQQKAAEDLKSTYETLIGSLQGELSSGKVQIEQVRDGIHVSLAQDILFRSGSADLDKTGRELLLKVAEDMKASPYQILVIGHTDNQKIGASLASRYPTNWELGGARSSRIVRLFQESGIASDRLSAVSSSDSRPRETNDTADGRAKNRRIEIRLRPVPTEQTAQQ